MVLSHERGSRACQFFFRTHCTCGSCWDIYVECEAVQRVAAAFTADDFSRHCGACGLLRLAHPSATMEFSSSIVIALMDLPLAVTSAFAFRLTCAAFMRGVENSISSI